MGHWATGGHPEKRTAAGSQTLSPNGFYLPDRSPFRQSLIREKRIVGSLEVAAPLHNKGVVKNDFFSWLRSPLQSGLPRGERKKTSKKKKHDSVETGISFRICVTWRQTWNRETRVGIVHVVTKLPKWESGKGNSVMKAVSHGRWSTYGRSKSLWSKQPSPQNQCAKSTPKRKSKDF